jgi:MFS family permease
MGWQLFFDSIPAILLPIPYGYLADTRGRKWVLVLGLTGYTLSLASILFFVRAITCHIALKVDFSNTPLEIQVGVLDLPLKFAWLSSLFFLVGGGPTVATTLATTIVADVVPTHLRYSSLLHYR